MLLIKEFEAAIKYFNSGLDFYVLNDTYLNPGCNEKSYHFVSYAVEYDFGADGDVEIVAVNEYKGTSFLFVFLYSKGIIQELFKKEIKNNKVLISKDYIEYYLPAGLDSVWNFYKGRFWAMTPYKN